MLLSLCLGWLLVIVTVGVCIVHRIRKIPRSLSLCILSFFGFLFCFASHVFLTVLGLNTLVIVRPKVRGLIECLYDTSRIYGLHQLAWNLGAGPEPQVTQMFLLRNGIHLVPEA